MKIKTYFPNLNALRFLAAFAVIIHHVEQTKWLYGLPNSFGNATINLMGSMGVTLFFVLSGFLITYLLLQEKQETHTISVGKFYMRRVLRIWPLYYLVVLLGLFVLPHFEFFHVPGWSADTFLGFDVKLLLFLLILPNAVLVLYPPMPFMKQTWSIGVEEQFYIIWPLIIKYTRNYLLPLFVILVSLVFFTNFFFWISNSGYIRNERLLSVLNFLKWYLSYFRVGSMAIGGMAAYTLFFDQQKILRLLYAGPVQYTVYSLLILLFAFGTWVPYIQHELYSCLFAVLILNLAANAKTVLRIENKSFNYLGKISYGLYMLHPLAITFAFRLVQLWYQKVEGVVPNLLLYVSTFVLTFLLAFLSYQYFEKVFLKSKHKFNPA